MYGRRLDIYAERALKRRTTAILLLTIHNGVSIYPERDLERRVVAISDCVTTLAPIRSEGYMLTRYQP